MRTSDAGSMPSLRRIGVQQVQVLPALRRGDDAYLQRVQQRG